MAFHTLTSITNVGTALLPGRRCRSLVVASAGEPARRQEQPANAVTVNADGRRRVMLATTGAAAATALGAFGRPAARAGGGNDMGTFVPWKEVSPEDPSVQEVARFAVQNHSSQTLQFVDLDKVLVAFRQVAATGYYYSLLISVNNFSDSKPVRYVAEVYRTTSTGQCFKLLYFVLA